MFYVNDSYCFLYEHGLIRDNANINDIIIIRKDFDSGILLIEQLCFEIQDDCPT